MNRRACLTLAICLSGLAGGSLAGDPAAVLSIHGTVGPAVACTLNLTPAVAEFRNLPSLQSLLQAPKPWHGSSEVDVEIRCPAELRWYLRLEDDLASHGSASSDMDPDKKRFHFEYPDTHRYAGQYSIWIQKKEWKSDDNNPPRTLKALYADKSEDPLTPGHHSGLFKLRPNISYFFSFEDNASSTSKGASHVRGKLQAWLRGRYFMKDKSKEDTEPALIDGLEPGSITGAVKLTFVYD